MHSERERCVADYEDRSGRQQIRSLRHELGRDHDQYEEHDGDRDPDPPRLERDEPRCLLRVCVLGHAS